MNKINSIKALKSFIDSRKSFEILYNSDKSFTYGSISRLCILDSSFNPPHKAHESLACKSIQFDYHKKCESNKVKDNALLLLLSVKNADKVVPKPASFDHRINMMCLMADKLSAELKVNVSVGLTDEAKFADKSHSITEYFKNNNQENLKLTFLLGFDTLIRIFDAKYYVPNTIEHSLREFMNSTDLFVLTRHSDTGDLDQFKYLEEIRMNLRPEIPLNWSDKIFLVQGDETFLKISSSEIRKDISENSIWKRNVLDEIAAYIEENNLYE